MFNSFYSNNILFSETKSTNKSPNYIYWSKSINSSAEILQDESFIQCSEPGKECWLGQTSSCSALLIIIELIGNRCLIPSLWCTRMEATQMFSSKLDAWDTDQVSHLSVSLSLFSFFNIRSMNLMNQVELFQWSSRLQQVFVYCVCQQKMSVFSLSFSAWCIIFLLEHDWRLLFNVTYSKALAAPRAIWMRAFQVSFWLSSSPEWRISLRVTPPQYS